jgi:hypothetical protein
MRFVMLPVRYLVRRKLPTALTIAGVAAAIGRLIALRRHARRTRRGNEQDEGTAKHATSDSGHQWLLRGGGPPQNLDDPRSPVVGTRPQHSRELLVLPDRM